MLIGMRLATSALHRQKAVCEICPALMARLANVLNTQERCGICVGIYGRQTKKKVSPRTM